MVRQLIKVALDMGWGECRTTTGKDRIDIIPSQQCTIVSTGNTRFISTLIKHRGDTRQGPLLRITHVEIVLGILEIVYVRGIVLSTTCCTSNQLCELACKRDMRWLFNVEERNLVKHRSKPLRLLFPVNIQSPKCVAKRFLAHIHLRGERLFAKMHQRTTYLQILREFVFPVKAQHSFALHTIVGIRFERYTNISTSVDDTLIKDSNLAGRVIHRVVRALGKYHTTSSNHYRTLRYIHGIKRDYIGRRTLILTYQHILIFLGYQFGYCLSRII